MTAIASNLQAVKSAIVKAAHLAQRREESIALLAVSKTFPSTAIRLAYEAGQSAFGENYVQEALDKMAELGDLPLEWHFIGPIQSNKTRLIAENFAWVHSVDRLKIAERLSAQRPQTLPPLNICIQVNISDEDSKSGIPAGETLKLALELAKLPRLKLRGLMTIPAPSEEFEKQRQPLACLHELVLQLLTQGLELDTLSMGMSHDFEAAIMEGATIVRIGSAIFGERK